MVVITSQTGQITIKNIAKRNNFKGEEKLTQKIQKPQVKIMGSNDRYLQHPPFFFNRSQLYLGITKETWK